MCIEDISTRKILDSIDQYVFCKNESGTYVYANEQFVRIAGIKENDSILGKTDFDLIWKDQAEFIQLRDKSVIDGQSVIKSKENQYRAGGFCRIMMTIKKYVIDKDNVCVIGNFFDCEDHLILETTGVFDEEKHRLYLGFVPEWLSPMEIRVCFYIIHGFPAPRIAEKIGVALSTIRFHIENIKGKINCSNKSEIIEKAMKTGIAWKIFTLQHIIALDKNGW